MTVNIDLSRTSHSLAGLCVSLGIRALVWDSERRELEDVSEYAASQCQYHP